MQLDVMNPKVVGAAKLTLERLAKNVDCRWFGSFTEFSTLVTAQDTIKYAQAKAPL
jgi:hypothetical protein